MTDNPQGVSDEADAGTVEMVGRGRWGKINDER